MVQCHKPGDFWEKQPLTGRSPGVPGEIAGLGVVAGGSKPLVRPSGQCSTP